MTIFVAGVHGAGKTFATELACQRLGLVHATASQLIRQERGLVSWDATKVVADVDLNQLALLSAAKRIRNGGGTLVLDGHFVLRRAPGDHEKLSVDVFRGLECSAVLLFRCAISVLLERLQARQDMSWNAAELADFSEAEEAHGVEVAKALNIPLEALDMPSMEEVDAVLERFSGAKQLEGNR